MSTLRVVSKFSVNNEQQRNVFYVAGAFAVVGNGQAIADYFRDAYSQPPTFLRNEMRDTWSFDGVEIKDVTDPANPVIPFGFTSGPLVGTQTNDSLLPLQNACLVSFKATTAPPNRSRKYLGGFTEASHQGDGWRQSTLDAVGGWATYMLGMQANLDPGIALVVARINNNVLVGSNILDTFTVTTYARTQRRRTPGRGI